MVGGGAGQTCLPIEEDDMDYDSDDDVDDEWQILQVRAPLCGQTRRQVLTGRTS